MRTSPQPGRHWIKASTVAKRLGVSVDLINGLAHGGQIQGYEAQRGTNKVWCIYEDQIESLALRMATVGVKR